MSLDFKPMPKRFMVWDTRGGDWLKVRDIYDAYSDRSADNKLLTFHDIGQAFSRRDSDKLIIIQSTNLFDKDDKEIFEGSIVENHFIHKFGLVYYDEDVAGWRILYQDGTWDDLYYVKADIVVAGHILSNPESLEGK